MYVFFPVLVQGLKKLKLKDYTMGSIFLAISVISGLVMAYIFYATSKSSEGADFSRIYYGTDTRAFSFFCAAGLACFYSKREIKSNVEKKIVYVLGIMGMISLAVFSFEIDYKNPLNYYGLMFLVSILFSFSIVLFSKPELKKFDISKYDKIIAPVIRLGQHQYQYYLWQYPVMIFAREYFKWSKLSNSQQFCIQFIVLIFISELSYYLFEKKGIKYISYPILASIALILVFSPIYENKDLEEMKAIQEALASNEKEEKNNTPPVSTAPTTPAVNTGDKVVILSNNDIAKTALFQILAGEMEPDSGTYEWGMTTSQSYFPKDNSEYFENVDLSLIDWMRQFSTDQHEEYVRGFLGRMLFSGEEARKMAKVLSGGEKVRCMLSKMMLSGANVLLLDNPTDHLDLESITSLNKSLIRFPGTVLFTTHDHEFIQTVANKIIEITPNGILEKEMEYDDYINDENVQQRLSELYGK